MALVQDYCEGMLRLAQQNFPFVWWNTLLHPVFILALSTNVYGNLRTNRK